MLHVRCADAWRLARVAKLLCRVVWEQVACDLDRVLPRDNPAVRVYVLRVTAPAAAAYTLVWRNLVLNSCEREMLLRVVEQATALVSGLRSVQTLDAVPSQRLVLEAVLNAKDGTAVANVRPSECFRYLRSAQSRTRTCFTVCG
jgi:hypothetical protein